MLNPISNWLGKLWAALAEPAASVQDPVDRQNARLVAALFVTLLPIGLLGAAIPSLLGTDQPLLQDNDFLILLPGTVLWGIAYFAIRAGHYRWPVGLSVGVASVVILAIVITDDSLEDTGYLLIPLLVSSLILHPSVTVAITVADVFGMLLLPSLMSGVTLEMVLMGPVIYIAFGSVLILLTAQHRNQIEKERQTRLRESEERLRSVISQSMDGLILIEDGVVSEWNQGLERITGVPAAEMIGRPMWYVLENLSPKEHKASARYQKQFADLKQLSEAPNSSWFNKFIEFDIVRADGLLGTVQMLLFPVHREDAVSIGGIIRDITDKKQVDDALKQRNQELALLHRAGQALTSTLELSEVLDATLGETRRILDIVACSIWLFDDESGDLVCRQVTGPKSETVRGWRLKSGQGIAGWIFENQESVIVPDTLTDTRYFGGVEEKTGLSMRSILGVPLVVRGQSIGVLEAVGAELDRFTPSDLELLQSLAASAAIAVQNARLFKRAQQQVAALEALSRTSMQLTSSLNLADVLDDIVESALTLVGATDVHIYLYDAPNKTFTFGSALWDDGSKEPAVKTLRPEGLVHTVARERQAIVISDAPNHPLYADPNVQKWKMQAVAGFPLMLADRVVGVFTLAFVKPHRFNSDELRVLGSLANQAAIAVENARLVQGLEAEVISRTEEILAEKEKSETVLQSVGDAIIMSDLENQVQYVNDAFLAQTGFTADEVMGKHSNTIGPAIKAEKERDAMKTALANKELWRGEAVGRRKDGRTYEAALTVAPVLDLDGELVGFVSSHRDISHQKELDLARSRFTTSVSHQLRTPVTNIKLYTHLLGQDVPEEKMQRYRRVLVEQTVRLEHLVQDLLEITALDSGEALRSWAPVVLSSIIDDIVARFHHEAQAVGQTFTAKPMPADLPMVKGDQVRLYQAVQEVVENAVTFTPAGGQVTIETDIAEHEGQNWVTIAVRDTGPGISSAELDKIFDRFFRGQLAESGHVPGSGLGLSIAKEIMRAHGGRLTVQSQQGEGSTFTLWLRVSPSQPAMAS